MTQIALFEPHTPGRAVIDPSGLYRYLLRREWNPELPCMLWVMLNPSTADASVNDPTIKRCLDFARQWGYGAIEVVNLFAWRATEPKKMMKADDPVGAENDRYIREAVVRASVVVAAWGTKGGHLKRDAEVLPMLGNVQCLGVTKDGYSCHPLYVEAITPLTPYQAESVR